MRDKNLGIAVAAVIVMGVLVLMLAFSGALRTISIDSVTTEHLDATDLPVAAECVAVDDLDSTQFEYGGCVRVVTAAPDSPLHDDFAPGGWDGIDGAMATLLRLEPTTATFISGLAGGVDGRLVIVLNSLDGSLGAGEVGTVVVLQHADTASAAANRFLFTDRQGRILLPGDSVSLLYDGTAARWREWPASKIWADFEASQLIGDATSELVNKITGTDASCSQAGSPVTGDIGVVACGTGTTATGSAFLHVGGQTDFAALSVLGQAFVAADVSVNSLSTGAQRFQVYVGFHNGASLAGTPSQGMYWQYDDTVSANWLICEDAATRACTDSGLAVTAGAFVTLAVYLPGDWTTGIFIYKPAGGAWALGGVPVASTNLVFVSGWGSASTGIVKSVGTTTRSLATDFLVWRFDRGS